MDVGTSPPGQVIPLGSAPGRALLEGEEPIIESLRLEETSEIIKSNHHPISPMPAKPCPQEPHPHGV